MDNLKNNGLVTDAMYRKMMRLQLIATLTVATVAYLLGGMHAGVSALAGGVSVLLGVFVASKVAMRSKDKTEPTAILLNLLKAEAVKILIIAIMLFLIFKNYQQLVPFALIAGLAGAALFSGAALAKVNKPL